MKLIIPFKKKTLGKSMALMLVKLGADVIIVSRKYDVLEAARKEIEELTTKKISIFALDIRDPSKISESIDFCQEIYGKLPDIIINNAAANFISPSERLSANAIKTIIDIVLVGTLNVTLTIGKRLIERKQSATFLSILANYIYHGSGFVLGSACAKSGVAAMTRSLAAEWSRYGLRFNAIAPGPIYTDGAFSRLDPTGEFTSQASERIPIGRLGKPEELSNLACYLVSDFSNWLNGEIVTFDGGELVYMAGEFNSLSKLISNEKWELIENMIRSNNKKSKL